MPDLGVKRDPFVAVVYVVLILCATYLLATNKITARELGGFFAGALIVPTPWWTKLARTSAGSSPPPPSKEGDSTNGP